MGVRKGWQSLRKKLSSLDPSSPQAACRAGIPGCSAELPHTGLQRPPQAGKFLEIWELGCPEKQGPTGPGQNGQLVQPEMPLSLLNSARKILSELRSPLRERCLVKVFPAVASSWSRREEYSERKGWELRSSHLRGVGGRAALWDNAFYRSECEHHRCVKTRGPGLPATAGLQEGVGTRGGLQGALELQQLALKRSLFTGQGGDSPQVFPDFNKFGGMVLFLFWWFFQLKERETEM